jgi:hypothetical protein
MTRWKRVGEAALEYADMQRTQDMRTYGIHATKDGKRIDPEDLYLSPTPAAPHMGGTL